LAILPASLPLARHRHGFGLLSWSFSEFSFLVD
jgi:hypothetical protein